MATDFITFCGFLAAVLKIGGILHAALYEIDVYRTNLSAFDENLKKVESIRTRTSCSREKGAVLDGQLRRIRNTLHKAERAVKWMPRDEKANPNPGAGELVLWMLSWKSIARAHEESLKSCSTELAELKLEMAEIVSKRQRPEMLFFELRRQETWTQLRNRADRHSKLYVGPGDQLSRSLAENVFVY